MEKFAKELEEYVVSILNGADIAEKYENFVAAHGDRLDKYEEAIFEFYTYIVEKHPDLLRKHIKGEEGASIVLSAMFESWRVAKELEWSKQDEDFLKNAVVVKIPKKIFDRAYQMTMDIKRRADVTGAIHDYLKDKYGMDESAIEKHIEAYFKNESDRKNN
jgi:hypothetical protein